MSQNSSTGIVSAVGYSQPLFDLIDPHDTGCHIIQESKCLTHLLFTFAYPFVVNGTDVKTEQGQRPCTCGHFCRQGLTASGNACKQDPLGGLQTSCLQGFVRCKEYFLFLFQPQFQVIQAGNLNISGDGHLFYGRNRSIQTALLGGEKGDMLLAQGAICHQGR